MDIGHMTRRVANDSQNIRPLKTALQLENGEAWSYGELHLISNIYGNKLKEMGVEKGDRVGILLYNCLDYFGIYFAIAKIGAVAVRINFRLTGHELEYILNDSGLKVLCFHSDLADELSEIYNRVPAEHFICLSDGIEPIPPWAQDWNTLKNGADQEIDVQINMDDPVMLMYTSGTTGRPKGAVWTHQSTYWFMAIQVMRWHFNGEETAMTTGPLYHVGAMEDIALPVLLAGGTVVITKSKGFEIERVMSVIEEMNVTDCFLFPFMIYDMLNSPKIERFQMSSLNRIFSGGDSLVPWAIEELDRRFPHVHLIEVYGLTEGTPIAASLNPPHVFEKSHTVGKPMPMVEIQIVNDKSEPASVGEVGEVLIKSPANSTGYWNNREATASTFVGGWCKTGDLGQYDKDGFLSIVGRKKDMIRSGGENIYAAEIEDALIRHEAIKDVAIIGVADPTYIEAVCAVVVKKDHMELSEEEVTRFCKGSLASYKKPRKVIFVDELPRTPSGKVKKFVLREKYA